MKEVIDFKIGEEYKESDILKSKEGIYLLVEKASHKEILKCCNCTSGNLYFKPFETYKEGEEYNVGDLLKIPKKKERGKFILAIVESEGDIKEVCRECAFEKNYYGYRECCVVNKCVEIFRDTNKDDVYYKPLAEVSEWIKRK